MNVENTSLEKLLQRYQAVVAENSKLKEENQALKAKLGIVEMPGPATGSEYPTPEAVISPQGEETTSLFAVTNMSEVVDKIGLFMSLFRGRDDVYAKRWEGKRDHKSGYSPVCLNEWQKGLCLKPRGTCTHCGNKAYAALDQGAVKKHLLGEQGSSLKPTFIRPPSV